MHRTIITSKYRSVARRQEYKIIGIKLIIIGIYLMSIVDTHKYLLFHLNCAQLIEGTHEDPLDL